MLRVLASSIERQGSPTDSIAYAAGRGATAGLDESRGSRRKRDVEGKDILVAGLDALRGSIHLQLDAGQVGIDAYGDVASGARIVALLGDVDSRLPRPVCLIPVKCIFPCHAVVRHESFVVPTGRVAFIATVAGEIKHVPNKLARQVFAGFHRLPVCLMERRLPLLRMKRTIWPRLRRR